MENGYIIGRYFEEELIYLLSKKGFNYLHFDTLDNAKQHLTKIGANALECVFVFHTCCVNCKKEFFIIPEKVNGDHHCDVCQQTLPMSL